eukprot:scpid84246/ scgid12479/ 
MKNVAMLLMAALLLGQVVMPVFSRSIKNLHLRSDGDDMNMDNDSSDSNSDDSGNSGNSGDSSDDSGDSNVSDSNDSASDDDSSDDSGMGSDDSDSANSEDASNSDDSSTDGTMARGNVRIAPAELMLPTDFLVLTTEPDKDKADETTAPPTG